MRFLHIFAGLTMRSFQRFNKSLLLVVAISDGIVLMLLLRMIYNFFFSKVTARKSHSAVFFCWFTEYYIHLIIYRCMLMLVEIVSKWTDTLILRVVHHTAAYLNMNVNLQIYKRTRIELSIEFIGFHWCSGFIIYNQQRIFLLIPIVDLL